MRNKALQIIIVFALMLMMVSPALAGPADEAVDQAVSWLKGQQNVDGGFSNGYTPDSGVSTTAEAVIALAAGRQDAGQRLSGHTAHEGTQAVFLGTLAEVEDAVL